MYDIRGFGGRVGIDGARAIEGLSDALELARRSLVFPDGGGRITRADDVVETALAATASRTFPPWVQSQREGYTPAGTFDRICWRNVVNSEIVRVDTVATGRALRPVASVFDTITTLSM